MAKDGIISFYYDYFTIEKSGPSKTKFLDCALIVKQPITYRLSNVSGVVGYKDVNETWVGADE